jgi:hypothetical protein
MADRIYVTYTPTAVPEIFGLNKDTGDIVVPAATFRFPLF